MASTALSTGLTKLKQANYAESGTYAAAFLMLSIGLERLMKLVILMDRKSEGNPYPAKSELKSLSHDLRAAWQATRIIAAKTPPRNKWKMAAEEEVSAVINVLAEFAIATRYYNLDFLTSGRASGRDPISQWHDEVGALILSRPRHARELARIERDAAVVGAALAGISLIRHTAEDGSPLHSAEAASAQTGRVQLIQRESVVICATIIRDLCLVLDSLARRAMASGIEVPHFSEHFKFFFNGDALFRRRMTFEV